MAQTSPGAAPQAAIDSPLLRNYSPVTRNRLLKPEDRNWLQIRRSYDGWGYSPLDKITPTNVSRLKLVWTAKTEELGAHQAPPLVNNGVMFISTPNNQVAAYDAKTGTLLWRYKRVRPATAFVAHPSNRGLALYGDKVYYGAGEAVVVALDAKTGKEVWAREVYDNTYRYYITLAPLAADGKILDFYYMPERAHLEVDEGQMISPGTLVAKTPREATGTQDITGGLPRVTEIFEARKPKDPAVIAEIDGTVELLSEKKRGKRSIIVRSRAWRRRSRGTSISPPSVLP